MKINITCSCGRVFDVIGNGIRFIHHGKENKIMLKDEIIRCKCGSDNLNFTSNLKIKKSDYP